MQKGKAKILRGKFDRMKMKEGENIVQYSERIKKSVSAIRSIGGRITNEIVVSKVLITLLPIYAIRVSKILEMRCNPKNNITLDALMGRLSAFELDNFGNHAPTSRNFESAFKARLTLGRKGGNSKENRLIVKKKMK